MTASTKVDFCNDIWLLKKASTVTQETRKTGTTEQELGKARLQSTSHAIKVNSAKTSLLAWLHWIPKIFLSLYINACISWLVALLSDFTYNIKER